MASTIAGFGGPFFVVYFSDDHPESNATWLAAAAVWRTASAPRKWGWRELLRRFRYHVGPLGAGFSLGRTAGHWSGSAGQHGEQETLYHPGRRVVRVLGKEYALPADGRTLVLLIDEDSSAGRAPRVTVRTIAAPMLPRPSINLSLDSAAAEEQMADASAREHAVWFQVTQQVRWA